MSPPIRHYAVRQAVVDGHPRLERLPLQRQFLKDLDPYPGADGFLGDGEKWEAEQRKQESKETSSRRREEALSSKRGRSRRAYAGTSGRGEKSAPRPLGGYVRPARKPPFSPHLRCSSRIHRLDVPFVR